MFALHGIAGRSENRYRKGNLQSRNIEDQFEAQPLSKQIVRRARSDRLRIAIGRRDDELVARTATRADD